MTPKYFLLLSLLFFINLPSNGQNQIEWAPIGATWHYQLRLELGDYLSWVRLESTKDTIVNNDTLRVLSMTASYPEFKRFPTGSVLLKQVSNRLYFSMNDTLHLLYDFSATIGDTLIIRNPQDLILTTTSHLKEFAYDTILVEDTFTSSINGVERRAQTVKSLGFLSSDYGPTIIEGIGSINYWLFATFITPIEDMDIFDGLRCYSDGLVGMVFFSDVVCDYDNTIVPVINSNIPLIKIYPNPTSIYITVDHGPISSSRTFYDITTMTGARIKSGILNGSIDRIDFESLSGPLMLLLYDDKRQFLAKRIIATH